MQALIASVPGISAVFAGGICAYSIDQKEHHLGVDRAIAAPVNCVSPEVALQMASGACDLFDVTLGIGTTGYAEPSPTMGVETPFAWVAVWTPDQHETWRIDCGGRTRTQVQRYIAAEAVSRAADWLAAINRIPRDSVS